MVEVREHDKFIHPRPLIVLELVFCWILDGLILPRLVASAGQQI